VHVDVALQCIKLIYVIANRPFAFFPIYYTINNMQTYTVDTTNTGDEEEEDYIFIFPMEGRDDTACLEDLFQYNIQMRINREREHKEREHKERDDMEKENHRKGNKDIKDIKKNEVVVWNTYAGLMQFHRMQTILEDEIY
jgi:hypothetical protein